MIFRACKFVVSVIDNSNNKRLEASDILRHLLSLGMSLSLHLVSNHLGDWQ